jgi:Protein of unknown function (DUF3592)
MTVGKFVTLRITEMFLILGPLFFVGASGCAIRNAFIVHGDLSTSGTITDVMPTTVGSEPFYQTTFSFKAEDGQTYKVTPNLNERPAPYKIGDTVPVVYDKTNPDNASISSEKEMWDLPIHFGLAGTFVFAIGLFLWKRNQSAYASFLGVSKRTSYEKV